MNIIQVTPNFPPSVGGVQNVVKELSFQLAALGHNVKVLTGFDGKGQKIKGAKNLKITYLRSFNFAHTPVTPSLFFELLKIPESSIIHVHISRAFIPEIVCLISKIRGIPYVAHYHLDIGASGFFGFLLPFYKKIFLRNVLLNAKKIIILSEDYRKLIKKRYGITKNLVVVPNGVSDKFFLKYSVPSKNQSNLLFVGRISVQKQVHILVESMKFVKSKVNLHIVGDGDLLQDVRTLAHENRLNNVKFYGSKTGEGLLKIYANADLFLLSSNKEGMPLVLLEAMAAGLPIIASDVEGTRELLGNNGILVKPNTPEKFAQEIDKLLKNKKRLRKFSKSGKKMAESFKWINIAKQIEKVYKVK